ncbi:GRAM domain-containing protein 2B isoform X2 [Ambystoma mexicanum]|uniref:GRAM domain-containing protein 2B isoform X2 n=1 Tax=Ambystoma mexicanum TaxID=8296 RepID=UPI0037E74B2E
MNRLSSDESVWLDEQPSICCPNPSDDAQPSPSDSTGSVFLRFSDDQGCEAHWEMDALYNSEAENGVDEKRKNAKVTPTVNLPLSSDADIFDSKKKTTPRSAMLTPDIINSSKLERKKSSFNQFSKTNAQYHKLFKDVPKEELVKQSFTCALQKELLYQGKLYISENWIGFHSKVFGKDTKITIPVPSVVMIKKTKTALLVPNALVISTATDRHIFVSLLSRDSTYKLLRSVCTHIENISVANSPVPSPAETSFRVERPTSLALDFNVDFSELDGIVRHRRQELEEFSSTGSQTPESENSQEFPMQAQSVLKVTKAEKTPIHSDIHIKHTHEGKHRDTARQAGSSRLQRLYHRTTSQQLMSLNVLLVCYAILVCILMFSTFYMRSKIITLEERLSTMGPFFMAESRKTWRGCLKIWCEHLSCSSPASYTLST